MTENSATNADDHAIARVRGPAARKSHSIRFSDAEWLTIQEQAEEREMTPGEYVRHAALSLGAGAPAAITAELPPGLVRLIEHTFRATYFASTVKHNELRRDGRSDEIDATIKQGRLAQAELLQGG